MQHGGSVYMQKRYWYCYRLRSWLFHKSQNNNLIFFFIILRKEWLYSLICLLFFLLLQRKCIWLLFAMVVASHVSFAEFRMHIVTVCERRMLCLRLFVRVFVQWWLCRHRLWPRSVTIYVTSVKYLTTSLFSYHCSLTIPAKMVAAVKTQNVACFSQHEIVRMVTPLRNMIFKKLCLTPRFQRVWRRCQ